MRACRIRTSGQRQRDDGDRARDERRARLELVHAHVLAEHRRHDRRPRRRRRRSTRGSPSRSCAAARSPAATTIPPAIRSRTSVSGSASWPELAARSRGSRARRRRARRCRRAPPRRRRTGRGASPMKAVPNSAAWFTVVRIAWARRRPSPCVVSARPRKTAPSVRLRVAPTTTAATRTSTNQSWPASDGERVEARRPRARSRSRSASAAAGRRRPTRRRPGRAVTSIGT